MKPLSLALIISLALIVLPQNETAVPNVRSIARSKDLAAKFIEHFNSGRPEQIHRFVLENYDPDFMKNYAGGDQGTAARILDLFRLYGPIKFRGIQDDFNPPIIWMQGIDTHGWIGMQWRSDKAGRLTHTVWRTRPPLAPATPAVSPKELPKELSDYLSRTSKKGNFSGVVLVAREGEVLFAKAYGFAERGKRRNRIDTRFNIGSVTKMIVGVATLRLVEQGKICLGDRIGKYIPEYPAPAGNSVTIRHLLTHTSGIEFDDFLGFPEARRDAETVENILKIQLKYAERAGLHEPAFRPSDEFNYANDNLELLGVIIERVAGKPWEEVVRERVLEPAGMKNTTFAMMRERGDSAIGYTALKGNTDEYSPEPRRDATPLLLRRASPAGQMYSTVKDLHSFLRDLLDQRLLSKETTTEMFSQHADAGELPALHLKSGYGYTVQILTGYGINSKGHGGVVPGYSAQVLWYPDLGYEVVVLSNFGDTAAHIVASYIDDLITDFSVLRTGLGPAKGKPESEAGNDSIADLERGAPSFDTSDR